MILVGLGGAIGAALRFLLSNDAGYPFLIIFAINVAGAFALGVASALTSGHVRRFLGTGMLGGFTTYSALAVDTVELLQDNVAWGLSYAVGSVVLGVGAAWLGLKVGPLAASRRSPAGQGSPAKRPAVASQPAEGRRPAEGRHSSREGES